MKTIILTVTITKNNVIYLDDLINKKTIKSGGSYKERTAVLEYIEEFLQDDLKAFALKATKEKLELLYISLKNNKYSICKMGGDDNDILFEMGYNLKYLYNFRTNKLGLILIRQF